MKDEPWRGDLHARCLHLEGKIGRQARELELMERKLAEARALLSEIIETQRLEIARLRSELYIACTVPEGSEED